MCYYWNCISHSRSLLKRQFPDTSKHISKGGLCHKVGVNALTPMSLTLVPQGDSGCLSEVIGQKRLVSKWAFLLCKSVAIPWSDILLWANSGKQRASGPASK